MMMIKMSQFIQQFRKYNSYRAYVFAYIHKTFICSSRYFASLYITKTCPCNIQRFLKLWKNENFQLKNFDIFLIFAQNIDCGYTLEPPRRGGSNEYPQSMFWSKNKKNRYTPPYPSFAM